MNLARQEAFSAALHGAGPLVGTPEPRLDIHRNNRMASLAASLAIAFPATLRIVGEDYFHAMAREFIQASPPRGPVLLAYGDELPDFIAAFPPAADIPYLADVARIEAAVTRAYHAQDALPLGVEDLQWLNGPGAQDVRLRLHAAVFVLRSPFPAATLWEHNLAADWVPVADWRGEDVVVCRPQMEVLVRVLPPGAGDFLQALMGGHSLGEAAARVASEGFDLPAALAFAFAQGLARPDVDTGPVAGVADVFGGGIS
ncbi:DNA-binding domain-containing protein [Phenylobacterium sp.]|uniref:HvfC/BufC N-terminal domain-containing protein n=1 Tax=Phenylobacterium sp. TaxID=1871053 RepID=UPI0027256D90|nr:DNA-binding domain-containing protein [Phenylobacterium sp.]MDO8799368.1 DNA-binding domain-containing protein [Phenylobacterium sp.]